MSPRGLPGMILAAGRGERMRPLTDQTPKPLLAVGGKPLLVWQLERMVQAGIAPIVINTAHLGEQISERLGDGTAWGIELRYSPEPPGALETAGGIATAAPWQAPEGESSWFALANGDVFADFDWRPLLSACQSEAPPQALGVLVMVPNPDHNPKGDFAMQGPSPAPLGLGDAHRLTYAGMGLFHRDLFLGCPSGERAALGPLLRAAAARGQLWGWTHSGLWVDVGTPERLSELNARLK